MERVSLRVSLKPATVALAANCMFVVIVVQGFVRRLRKTILHSRRASCLDRRRQLNASLRPFAQSHFFRKVFSRDRAESRMRQRFVVSASLRNRHTAWRSIYLEGRIYLRAGHRKKKRRNKAIEEESPPRSTEIVEEGILSSSGPSRTKILRPESSKMTIVPIGIMNRVFGLMASRFQRVIPSFACC